MGKPLPTAGEKVREVITDLAGAVMEYFLFVTSVRRKHGLDVATFGPLTHRSLASPMLAELLLGII